ncbi:MAG: GNAT family N-acetyltransferase [Oceanospirillales bacterium]|nr:GNAT family N-acetyltransferase [Oceanospirillales bacterium]
MTYKVERYTQKHERAWNDFLEKSKNSHFMFFRQYTDYHSDRFEDFSLIFSDEKGRVVALLPANLANGVCYTHQGLSFGGFLTTEKTSTQDVIALFNTLIDYLKQNAISRLVYKPVPHFYHSLPAQEDLYALYRNGAALVRRDVSSVIDLQRPIRYSKGRKWSVNKAKKANVSVVEKKDLSEFWSLLTNTLESQHKAQPVHTIKEVQSLRNAFPDNIRLFVAERDQLLLAGALLFVNRDVVHTQYLANSEAGREMAALDLVLDYLITGAFREFRYFSFGISTEDNGRYLNEGLIAQKEGFGARAVVHDIYEIAIP